MKPWWWTLVVGTMFVAVGACVIALLVVVASS